MLTYCTLDPTMINSLRLHIVKPLRVPEYRLANIVGEFLRGVQKFYLVSAYLVLHLLSV